MCRHTNAVPEGTPYTGYARLNATHKCVRVFPSLQVVSEIKATQFDNQAFQNEMCSKVLPLLLGVVFAGSRVEIGMLSSSIKGGLIKVAPFEQYKFAPRHMDDDCDHPEIQFALNDNSYTILVNNSTKTTPYELDMRELNNLCRFVNPWAKSPGDVALSAQYKREMAKLWFRVYPNPVNFTGRIVDARGYFSQGLKENKTEADACSTYAMLHSLRHMPVVHWCVAEAMMAMLHGTKRWGVVFTFLNPDLIGLEAKHLGFTKFFVSNRNIQQFKYGDMVNFPQIKVVTPKLARSEDMSEFALVDLMFSEACTQFAPAYEYEPALGALFIASYKAAEYFKGDAEVTEVIVADPTWLTRWPDKVPFTTNTFVVYPEDEGVSETPTRRIVFDSAYKAKVTDLTVERLATQFERANLEKAASSVDAKAVERHAKETRLEQEALEAAKRKKVKTKGKVAPFFDSSSVGIRSSSSDDDDDVPVATSNLPRSENRIPKQRAYAETKREEKERKRREKQNKVKSKTEAGEHIPVVPLRREEDEYVGPASARNPKPQPKPKSKLHLAEYHAEVEAQQRSQIRLSKREYDAFRLAASLDKSNF